MEATDTTAEVNPLVVHLKESLWASRTVCDQLSDGTDTDASIWIQDTTCQECLIIAHTVSHALTPEEAAPERRILIRDGAVVTIPVSDEAAKILNAFWKDSIPALTELLEPVGLDPNDLLLIKHRQCLFTDSQL